MAPHHLWIIIMIKLYIIGNTKITCTNTITIGWRVPFFYPQGVTVYHDVYKISFRFCSIWCHYTAGILINTFRIKIKAALGHKNMLESKLSS